MEVLFATSEAVPFAAFGGLGDVACSLPAAMRKRSVACRVVLPLYEDVPEKFREQMKFITGLSVPVAWRRQYCGVFEAHHNGVIYYLLDNQYYFKRPGLYGHYDDAERFAFFSHAVLEMISHIDFQPDILHANDWQCGLLPLYFNLFYKLRPGYENIKTVYTIHNIQNQGKCGFEILEDVFGIPDEARPIVEQDGCINLMKAGIQTADCVTTVSPTYAREILDPWYSHGLDRVLMTHKCKLFGILNGIDTETYNPETDTYIAANYSADDTVGKADNKRELQNAFKLPNRAEVPLIAMVTRLVQQKGLALVKAALLKLLSEDVQFVVLGSGDWTYESFFKDTMLKHPDKISCRFGFIPELAHKVYAGADIFLMPSKSEPCGNAQMIACRYGAVPVVRETGGLKDSIIDFDDGLGLGFTFSSFDQSDMMNAISRALDAYSDKKLWESLISQCMQKNFSWGRSANEYIRLYRKLLKNGK